MKEHGNYESGLIINLESEEGKILLKCICCTEELESFEDLEAAFDCDWYSIAEHLPNATYFSAEGSSFFYPLGERTDGNVDFSREERLDGNYFAVSLFDTPKFFGVPYKTLEELVAAYRNLVGEYLPDDFDYAAHIGIVIGTYYG